MAEQRTHQENPSRFRRILSGARRNIMPIALSASLLANAVMGAYIFNKKDEPVKPYDSSAPKIAYLTPSSVHDAGLARTINHGIGALKIDSANNAISHKVKPETINYLGNNGKWVIADKNNNKIFGKLNQQKNEVTYSIDNKINKESAYLGGFHKVGDTTVWGASVKLKDANKPYASGKESGKMKASRPAPQAPEEAKAPEYTLPDYNLDIFGGVCTDPSVFQTPKAPAELKPLEEIAKTAEPIQNPCDYIEKISIHRKVFSDYVFTPKDLTYKLGDGTTGITIFDFPATADMTVNLSNEGAEKYEVNIHKVKEHGIGLTDKLIFDKYVNETEKTDYKGDKTIQKDFYLREVSPEKVAKMTDKEKKDITTNINATPISGDSVMDGFFFGFTSGNTPIYVTLDDKITPQDEAHVCAIANAHRTKTAVGVVYGVTGAVIGGVYNSIHGGGSSAPIGGSGGAIGGDPIQ